MQTNSPKFSAKSLVIYNKNGILYFQHFFRLKLLFEGKGTVIKNRVREGMLLSRIFSLNKAQDYERDQG